MHANSRYGPHLVAWWPGLVAVTAPAVTAQSDMSRNMQQCLGHGLYPRMALHSPQMSCLRSLAGPSHSLARTHPLLDRPCSRPEALTCAVVPLVAGSSWLGEGDLRRGAMDTASSLCACMHPDLSARSVLRCHLHWCQLALKTLSGWEQQATVPAALVPPFAGDHVMLGMTFTRTCDSLEVSSVSGCPSDRPCRAPCSSATRSGSASLRCCTWQPHRQLSAASTQDAPCKGLHRLASACA